MQPLQQGQAHQHNRSCRQQQEPFRSRPYASLFSFSKSHASTASEVLGRKLFVSRVQSGNAGDLRDFWEYHSASREGWASDGLHLMSHHILKMKKLCDQYGIPLMIVYYPWPHYLYNHADPQKLEQLKLTFPYCAQGFKEHLKDQPFAVPSHYERFFDDFCHRKNLMCLNTFPYFRGDPEWPQLFIEGDSHFSRKGHQLVGEHISRFLMRHLEVR